MLGQVTLTWRRLGIGAVALVLAGLLLSLLVAASGLYNIAASRGHPFLLREFLELGMRRSVEMHAGRPVRPDLTDSGLNAWGSTLRGKLRDLPWLSWAGCQSSLGGNAAKTASPA
mgnify:CR=1 FL=1